MACKVHILATCRKPELLPYTLLVFKTLRVGFPTAEIVVWENGQYSQNNGEELLRCCDDVDAKSRMCDVIHHDWIYELLRTEIEPFWICDTDVIFYGNVEQWKFDASLAGFRIPEFQDDFSGAITRSRLHTSLLYLDPKRIEASLEQYTSRLYYSPFTPQINLVAPVVLPFKQQPYFYDTCSLLYHAIGGRAFADEQKDAYFHFHFGSISDLVIPRLNGDAKKFQESRQAIVINPLLGRGVWRYQEEYFAKKSV